MLGGGKLLSGMAGTLFRSTSLLFDGHRVGMVGSQAGLIVLVDFRIDGFRPGMIAACGGKCRDGNCMFRESSRRLRALPAVESRLIVRQTVSDRHGLFEKPLLLKEIGP